MRTKRIAAAAAGLTMILLAAGCSSPGKSKPLAVVPTGVLRLGYLPDLADSPALVGLQLGFIGTDMGAVSLHPVSFTSTAAEAQALMRGQLDAAYLDPVTAVGIWQAEAARGGLIKIIAGAASGGVQFVVRRGITSVKQLNHSAVAAPPGGAQETALDWWLKQNGIKHASPRYVTMTGPYLVRAMRARRLAAAWEPAPLDVEMVAAGGRVMVNEASLWPGGQFSTAVLVITNHYLTAHAAAVRLLLRGQLQAERYLTTARSRAEKVVGRKLAGAASPALPAAVLARGFAQFQFTNDPLASSILTEAQHAAAVRLIGPIQNIVGLVDLDPLDIVLKANGQQPITS